MNADTYIKFCLLKYPDLFKNRIQVLIHLFAVIGNGTEWNKRGELVSVCEKTPTKKVIDAMKMDNEYLLKEIERYKSEIGKVPCLDDLNKAWLLNAEFTLMCRKFVEENIDLVASNEQAMMARDYEVYTGYYIENPCYKYAHIFNIPENITKSWARAAYDLAKFWQHRLYQKNQGFYSGNKTKDDPQTFEGKKKEDWKLACRLSEIIDKTGTKIGCATSKEQSKIANDILNKLKKEEKKSAKKIVDEGAKLK